MRTRHGHGTRWRAMVCAVGVLIGAGSAQAATWTETSTLGPVTATLATTFASGSSTFVQSTAITLTITRSDGGPSASYSGSAFQPWGPEGDFVDKKGAVKVVDLDRNGDPEVLVNVFTGGAHCCFVTWIATRPPATPAAYTLLTAFWGNWGSKLTDLNHDGIREFAGFDDRFAYAFGSYVDSVLPARVWNLRGGRLHVTTGEYHRYAVTWMRRDWRTYLLARRLKRPVAGPLAAYLASSSAVGGVAPTGAWKRAARLEGAAGKPMLRRIHAQLVQWGYIPAS